MNGPRVFNAKTAELARDGRANLFDRSGHAHVLCASENWVVVRLGSRLMESALGLPKLHSLWSHREGQSKLPIVPKTFETPIIVPLTPFIKLLKSNEYNYGKG